MVHTLLSPHLHMIKYLLTALFAVILACPATKAITINFENDTVGQAPVSGPGYTISVIGNPTVQDTSVGGLYAAPEGDTSKYLAIQGGQTVTIQFAQLQSSGSFLWGSPDSYNSISLSGGAFPFTLTGAGLFPVTFEAPLILSFRTLSFTTTQNSFELDNIVTQAASVPDGGTTAALLGLAMLGIVAVRSKLSVA